MSPAFKTLTRIKTLETVFFPLEVDWRKFRKMIEGRNNDVIIVFLYKLKSFRGHSQMTSRKYGEGMYFCNALYEGVGKTPNLE